MKKVSVIVPVYNASEYIVRCLSSIVNQTLDQIEIVLVDDHGTDGSITIAKDFFNGKDADVIFLSTETNSGPGAARNIGIAAASGEYVAFVDCDDAIDADFCSLLYEQAISNDADLAFCHILKHGVDGKESVLRNPLVASGPFDISSRHKYMAEYQSLFTSYLYRRTLLTKNSIAFPPTRSSEDSCFLAEALLCTHRIACVDKPLYIYYQRETSLSLCINADRYLDKFRSFDALFAFANERRLMEENREILEFIYLKKAFMVSALNYLCNAQRPDVEALKQMRRMLETVVPCHMHNSHMTPKLRALAMLIMKTPRLACLILPPVARKMML